MIFPPNRLTIVDKLDMLTNTFRPVGEAAMEISFKKCCTA